MLAESCRANGNRNSNYFWIGFSTKAKHEHNHSAHKCDTHNGQHNAAIFINFQFSLLCFSFLFVDVNAFSIHNSNKPHTGEQNIVSR